MTTRKTCPYRQFDCPQPFEVFSELCKKCVDGMVKKTEPFHKISNQEMERMVKNGGYI